MKNSQAKRDMAKTFLKGQCVGHFSPSSLITKWKAEILNTNPTGCFAQAVEDSANRTLYFRREYVTMYMSYTPSELQN